jgi:hypothetical protein
MSSIPQEDVLVVPRSLFDSVGAFQGFSGDVAAYLPARYRPANVRRLIDHAIRHFATRTSGDV